MFSYIDIQDTFYFCEHNIKYFDHCILEDKIVNDPKQIKMYEFNYT